MKSRVKFGLALAALLLPVTAAANPVLMISIDGLRPADIADAPARGLKVPNLRAIMSDGVYATGVRNVLPTVTYPDHTTLVTGVWPDKHGITNNTVFDPLQTGFGAWYWYAADIKVPTLWDAVHDAHGVVASIGWPVSVGAPSIDYNVPEYWRARNADDLKLLAALSTPGLITELVHTTGVPQVDTFGADPANDEALTRYAAAIIVAKHPQLMTLHVSSLDHFEHQFGPGSPEAKATLERIDASIGKLIADARKTERDLVVAIVSDHGFASVEHDVNLIQAFIDAGLVTYDADTRKITAWQAIPWNAGGSSAIMLAHPNDAALVAKVSLLLKKLASDPANGIGEVIDKSGIANRGGGVEPSFWVDFKMGYEGGSKADGPLVSPGSNKGMHGYFPVHPEMRATFMADVPGLKKKGSLGEIDMRDIAPTLAKILGVALPSATGRPLF